MKLKTLIVAGIFMLPATFITQTAQAAPYCKSHTKTVRVNGNIIAEHYKTCLRPDGSWVIASHSGHGGHYDDSHDRNGMQSPTTHRVADRFYSARQ